MLYISSDHAGFNLKNELKIFLVKDGFAVKDLGPNKYIKSDDYPDYVAKVARVVKKNPDTNKGIVIGASGQGEAIAVNRFSKIRAVVYYGGPIDILRFARQHNNANILSLGARFVSLAQAKKAVKIWLTTPFSGKIRHKRRNNRIDKIIR